LSALNQMREPYIVEMASEVARLDPAVPEAGREDNEGDREQLQPMFADEHGCLRECGRASVIS
jgi:hypothetical protein